MNDIKKLIDDVNFAAIPNAYPEYAQQLPQRIDSLLKYFKSNPSVIFNIDGSFAFQLGRAFNVVFRSFNDVENEDAKFAFRCATIGLCKAVNMGTMQSAIAARDLYHLLNDCQSLTEILLIQMGNEYMEERYHISKELYSPDLNWSKIVEWRFKRIAYYLAQVVRLQDAFKDADLKACKIGELYLDALLFESEQMIQGYMALGICC